jgi:hypothetical protein
VLSRVSSLFLVQLWLGRTLVYSGIGIDIILFKCRGDDFRLFSVEGSFGGYVFIRYASTVEVYIIFSGALLDLTT